MDYAGIEPCGEGLNIRK